MKITRKGAIKVAKEESLLGIGMVLITVGTTSLIAGNYLNGFICFGVGLGTIYARGFLKK